jgi:hypothetical protein
MIGIVALVLQAASPAIAVERPAKAWEVEYRADGCAIRRSFGAGPESAVLVVDADPVSGLGNIMLMLPQLTARAGSGDALITVVPGGSTIRVPWSALAGKPDVGSFMLIVGRTEWDRILVADAIEIRGIARSPIAAPVKGIAKAVDAAKTCGRDLLQSWGVDPNVMIDVPQEQTFRWFSPDDYPAGALLNRKQGAVKIVGTVDGRGKPIACRTVVSSGVTSLDEATCGAFMRRATFARSATSVRYIFHKTVWMNPN